MNCFIIDDEPKALDILETYLKRTSFISLKGRFRDPIQAMNAIVQDGPDLIFADINMPGLTGIQLVKSLRKPPLIIFTTAYSEYAIESYEFNALDYLLKPIDFDRFLKAALRAKEQFDLIQASTDLPNQNEKPDQSVLFLKSGTKTHRVSLSDIIFIEGMGNYVNFVTGDKKICVYMGIQDALNILPSQKFVRIHKSYIISLEHIVTIEIHQVKSGNHIIPVGKNYRDLFLKFRKD